MWKIGACLAACAIAFPAPAGAWDYSGHRIVGDIADIVLQRDHPDVHARVLAMLERRDGTAVEKRTLVGSERKSTLRRLAIDGSDRDWSNLLSILASHRAGLKVADHSDPSHNDSSNSDKAVPPSLTEGQEGVASVFGRPVAIAISGGFCVRR